MTLRNIRETETFAFTDAAGLRDWLNLLDAANLDTVFFSRLSDGKDTLTFHYETVALSDGSEVNDITYS